MPIGPSSRQHVLLLWVDYLGDHVIDEAVLIPDARLLKLALVVRLIHVCKDL